jgi:hypothetical protein
MRQRRSVITRKVSIGTENENFPYALPVIMADSVEVMENYYRSKIQMLEGSLTQLTLLEDAKEIYVICRKITQTKGMLRKVILRKKI